MKLSRNDSSLVEQMIQAYKAYMIFVILRLSFFEKNFRIQIRS